MVKLFQKIKNPAIIHGKIWLFFFVLAFITLIILSTIDYLGYGMIAKGGYSIFEIDGEYIYFTGIQWFALLSAIVSTMAIVGVDIIHIALILLVSVFNDFWKPKTIEQNGTKHPVLATYFSMYGLVKATVVEIENSKSKFSISKFEELGLKATKRIEQPTTICKIYFIFLLCFLAFFLTILGILTFNFKSVWNGDWYTGNGLWRDTSFSSTEWTNHSHDRLPEFLNKKETKKYYSFSTRHKVQNMLKQDKRNHYIPYVLLKLQAIDKLEGEWKRIYVDSMSNANERMVNENVED